VSCRSFTHGSDIIGFTKRRSLNAMSPNLWEVSAFCSLSASFNHGRRYVMGEGYKKDGVRRVGHQAVSAVGHVVTLQTS